MLKLYGKVLMRWTKPCQVSYPVWGQLLFTIYSNSLRCFNTPPCLLTIFISKRDNFVTYCLLPLVANPSERGQHIKGRICSSRSKFFSLRVDPIETGPKNENGRVASPETIPILLKIID